MPCSPMEGFSRTEPPDGSARDGYISTESFVFRLRDGKGGSPFLARKEASLAVESPLTVYLDGRELVTLLATPTDVEDLALGYLCSEGIVDSAVDVKRIDADLSLGLIRVRTDLPAGVLQKRLDVVGRRVLTSGCGANPHVFKAADFEGAPPPLQVRGPEVKAEVLTSLAKEVGQASTVYRLTRGSHCAAIGSLDGTLLVVREDIGRHNAVDKALGCAIRSGMSPSDKIVLVTGRASSDIVAKCARLGFPFVVSRSAPTDLAVKAAHRSGITLVGLARGISFTAFSHPHRIATPQDGNAPWDAAPPGISHAPASTPSYINGLKELISPAALRERVRTLGRQIAYDYRGKRPILIGVLQGSFMFMADLARAVEVPVETDFMAVSSYGSGTESNGQVVITKDLGGSIRKRDVLLVEDIVDTGRTLAYVIEHLLKQHPRTLKVCALLDKPSRRKVHVRIDYVGFTIPDVFVVGYGLDFDGLYRNLQGIYVGIEAVPAQAREQGSAEAEEQEQAQERRKNKDARVNERKSIRTDSS